MGATVSSEIGEALLLLTWGLRRLDRGDGWWMGNLRSFDVTLRLAVEHGEELDDPERTAEHALPVAGPVPS